MKRTSENLMIAKAIIDAQAGSDTGKGIETVGGRVTRLGRHNGYACKPGEILRAVNAIKHSKSPSFRYYVKAEGDQNGYPSILVFFEFKFEPEEKWRQISFHTPWNRAPKALKELAGSGSKTRWNRVPGGSYRECENLKEYLGIR